MNEVDKVAPQASEPYAVLVFELGEEGPFDRKPVKPNSMQHLHAKRDPNYGYVELYTHPTQQGLEQDAARYRWLREESDLAAGWHGGIALAGFKKTEQHKSDLDGAIDAAIAAQAKQGGQANG